MKQRPIRCSEVASYVCENLTEGLNSPRCRALKKHLAECPNCTAYLDSLRKTVRLFKTVGDPRLPGNVRKHLHSVINVEELRKAGQRGRRTRRPTSSK